MAKQSLVRLELIPIAQRIEEANIRFPYIGISNPVPVDSKGRTHIPLDPMMRTFNQRAKILGSREDFIVYRESLFAGELPYLTLWDYAQENTDASNAYSSLIQKGSSARIAISKAMPIKESNTVVQIGRGNHIAVFNLEDWTKYKRDIKAII